MKYCQPCICNLASINLLSADEIIDRCCLFFMTTREFLLEKKQDRESCQRRYMVAKLLKDKTNLTLKAIAKLLDRNTHGNIINSINKFDIFYANEEHFRDTFSKLKAFL